MNPRYPVYVISKGRWDTRLTVRALESISVPYRVVVEPQERDRYAEVIDPARKTWVVKNDDGTIAATGTKWFCDYCDHRPRCIEDGAG